MRRFSLLLAALAGLLVPSVASAQQLARSAETLQNTLDRLAQEVAVHVPRSEGRGNVLHDIAETRNSLGKVRSRVYAGAPRGDVANSVYESRKKFDQFMRTLDKQVRRPSLRGVAYEAGGQMGRVEVELSLYRPVVVVDPTPARDERARSIAIRYLAERFRVSSRAIDVRRMTATNNKYRVYARVPGVGGYVVTLDAVGGSVFSAEPWL